MSNPSNYIDATIDQDETTSGAIDLNGKKMVGLELPASFTGASVSFTECRSSAGTFRAVYKDDGSLYAPTVVDGYVALDPAVMVGCAYVKIVSASSEAAARTLTAVCIEI